MIYVLIILMVAVGSVLLLGIMGINKLNDKNKDCCVALPSFLWGIGMVCSCVFLVVAVICLLTSDGPSGGVVGATVFTLFSALGSALILAALNCRIVYDDTFFEATNFLGIKRTYTYDRITGIQGLHQDVKLYVGDSIVRIDDMAIGKQKFLDHARKQYRIRNNGKAIPVSTNGKKDLFYGNVESPGEFIFVYILIGAVIVGMLILITVDFAPKSPGDLDYATLSFDRYEVVEERLQLYTSDDPMYYSIIGYRETMTDSETFLAHCDAGEKFTIGYTMYAKADEPHYGIECMTGKDGRTHLTMEAVHDYRYGDAWALYLIFGGFGLLWFVYVAMSIYVGRHPEKFSPRFVYLCFFKPGYIHGLRDEKKR